MWVSPADVGLDEFDEFAEVDYVPVCPECWPEDEVLDCLQCSVGNFCEKHQTEDEWVMSKIREMIYREGDDYDGADV